MTRTKIHGRNGRARGRRALPFRASPARLVIAAALLVAAAAPSSAQAATSITIGNGFKPGVAVDPAGTAYIAWYGPEANTSTLRFCRLPRGAGACAITQNIATPGTSLSRPFVTVSGSRVRVVSYRYGLSGSPFAQVYEFISTNGGASFDSGRPIGSPPFDEGVLGPGDTLSVATNAFSEGLVFQNMPLEGSSSAGDARAVLSSDHPYNGSVGLIDASTPLVVFANGSSFAQFRRYDRSGSPNDAANWTPAVDIGYADYARLAGGATGLFMIAGTASNAIVARKWDGSTFTPGVTIARSGDDAQQHLTQDAAGRLHAVFPRTDAKGDLALAYATSDNGTAWRSKDLFTSRPGAGIFELRAAVAPDHLGIAAFRTRPVAGAEEIRVVRIGPVDSSAPRISRPSLSRRRFRARGKNAGTKFRYRLSEAARVRLTIARRSAGRRVGGKCLKGTRGRRGRPRCVRYPKVGTLSRRGKSGVNTTKFTGRLNGRPLPAGRYRAALTAIDAAGNRSVSRNLSLTVLHPPSPCRLERCARR